MTYITKEYVETYLSAQMVDALLGYGEKTSTSDKNAKMDLLISASSDVVDDFLRPAGYTLPLSTTPHSIKQACFYLTINSLYASAYQDLPETFKYQLEQQYGFLNLLREKKLQLVGLEQDTDIGTGANTFDLDPNNTGTNTERIFSVTNLRGTFF